MERIIKLIWDFNGDDAVLFAEHHKKHLAAFANKENLLLKDTGLEEFSPNHAIAYLLVKESQVYIVRDALKPKRAEIVE